MIEFSLSRRRAQSFPESIEDENGITFPIRAGHQTILRIFRLLQDETIAEHHRIAKACGLFFGNGKEPEDPFLRLLVFLNYGDPPEPPDANEGNDAFHKKPEPRKIIDFEFDAPEIYTSFLQVFHIDLLETDLHWYRFGILFQSLLRIENTPISHKVHLRTLDTSHLKGRAKQNAEALKRSVAIPDKLSAYDQIMEARLLAAIQNGESPAQILREWK